MSGPGLGLRSSADGQSGREVQVRRLAMAFDCWMTTSRYPNELFEFLRMAYLTTGDLAGRKLEEVGPPQKCQPCSQGE